MHRRVRMSPRGGVAVRGFVSGRGPPLRGGKDSPERAYRSDGPVSAGVPMLPASNASERRLFTPFSSKKNLQIIRIRKQERLDGFGQTTVRIREMIAGIDLEIVGNTEPRHQLQHLFRARADLIHDRMPRIALIVTQRKISIVGNPHHLVPLSIFHETGIPERR